MKKKMYILHILLYEYIFMMKDSSIWSICIIELNGY